MIAWWALRVLIAGGPVVALLATGPAGVWPRPALIFVVAVVSLGFAAFPESSVGVVAMGLVLAWWGIGFRDGLHATALVAGAALLTSHIAAILASYGPRELVPQWTLVRRWLLRGLVVFLPAPALYAVAVAVRSVPEPPYIWVLGAATGAVALVSAAVIFSRYQDA